MQTALSPSTMNKLHSADDAQTYFRNMRNKYSREKKKLGKAKVSGAGQDDVTEAKKDLSEMYPYL